MTLRSRVMTLAAAGLMAAGLVVATPPATATAPTQQAERRAAPTPTLTAGRPRVVSGSGLVLTGKVRPARAGTKVVLQQLKPGRRTWVVEARLKTTKHGVFRYRDHPHVAGLRHYRVVVPATRTAKARHSKAVPVTVYAWRSLTKDIAVRESEGTYASSSVRINGQQYGSSFLGARYSSEGWVDWNLDRSCLRVRARFGDSDLGDEGVPAAVTVVADQVTKYAKTFSLAHSEVRSVDVTGAFRVAFSWTTGSERTGASAVMAEPQALCSF